jgi:hypothetical protein
MSREVICGYFAIFAEKPTTLLNSDSDLKLATWARGQTAPSANSGLIMILDTHKLSEGPFYY